jgi:3-methyladenine DNA glycosylase Tag
MAIPEVIEPSGLSDHLAILSRAIFQAGMSWKMIEGKWHAYLRLFENFDPVAVAAFGEGDVERIMADGGVVRTRKKIEATVANARAFLEIARLPGGIDGYLASFPSYAALVADLRARFKFLGELSAYYYLFRISRPVPRFEAWETTVEGDHPRMREMVALARDQGRSPERDDA